MIIRNVLVYFVCFLCVFNFVFLPEFTDSRQTTGMFIITSFITVVLTFFFFWVSIFLFKKAGIKVNIWVAPLLLFIISELSIFIIAGGEVCFFGIIYKLHLSNKAIANDTAIFREKRDFAFSMSFLISALVCVIQRMIFYKRAKSIV